jgi:hypothetical protein
VKANLGVIGMIHFSIGRKAFIRWAKRRGWWMWMWMLLATHLVTCLLTCWFIGIYQKSDRRSVSVVDCILEPLHNLDSGLKW